ncbi:MAG: glycosyltransferase family 2 protein [Acidobacteriia bacterium]|nr:glycosyltransferase family 2 protein [Terriglobia bacterium]
MKVTVLVAAYNCEVTLGASLASAVGQSYPASQFEVLVVDDGSTDGTAAVAEGFGGPQSNVRVLRAPHRGLAATCNAGLAAAQGEYLVRLDGDDRFDPDCLVMMARVLDANAGVGLVYADRIEAYEDGRRIRVEMRPFDLLKTIACGMMFRTAQARLAGGYDDLLFEEYDFLIRYLQIAPETFHLPVPLYTYVRHGAGMTARPEYWDRGWRQLEAKWGAARLQALGCDRARLTAQS